MGIQKHWQAHCRTGFRSARTVDNRATVVAGLGNDGKATAEDYR